MWPFKTKPNFETLLSFRWPFAPGHCSGFYWWQTFMEEFNWEARWRNKRSTMQLTLGCAGQGVYTNILCNQCWWEDFKKIKPAMEVYWQRRFAEEFVLWQRESWVRASRWSIAPASCTCIHCIAPAIAPSLQSTDTPAILRGQSRGWWQWGVMVSGRHYLGLVCHRDTIAAAATDLHIPPPCTQSYWTSGNIWTGEDTGVDTGRSRNREWEWSQSLEHHLRQLPAHLGSYIWGPPSNSVGQQSLLAKAVWYHWVSIWIWGENYFFSTPKKTSSHLIIDHWAPFVANLLYLDSRGRAAQY